MCAPGDQRKSSNDQREQAELNALRCERWAMFGSTSDLAPASREFLPVNCRRLNSRNEWLWNGGAWREADSSDFDVGYVLIWLQKSVEEDLEA